MKKTTLLLAFFGLFGLQLFGQHSNDGLEKKEIRAFRTVQKIKIDGQIDETDWQKADAATDFFSRFPNGGKPSEDRTVARVLFDDNSIYVAIYCFQNADSISNPLNIRDNLDQSDWAGILIDTYRDGQNALEFDLMASNVQFDSKYSVAAANSDDGNGDGEDQSWDGVWMSATSIQKDGWVAEFEIPYATLRFPKKKDQSWGVQFLRRINKKGKQDCWNRATPDRLSVPQAGILSGISDIKAPLRLSATPFLAQSFSNYYDKNGDPQRSWSRSFGAGFDIKYGINQAFTLDATVIPDFSQVRSDNQVLNLSPFEVRFNENRPFFMEGTELFNKGGLFYSRRIGGRALNRWKVADDTTSGGFRLPNEAAISNPVNVQLLNATKISGRTEKGMGIGIFNAVEDATFGAVKNIDPSSEDFGRIRRIETSPLTNKNIFVLDQNLKNNSFVTLINTNVMRSGGDYDANTTGGLFSLRNKKNTYKFAGRGVVSQKYFAGEKADLGRSWSAEFEKTSGKLQWHVEAVEESANFDPNDLGYLYSPNEQNTLAWVNYNQFEKRGKWNNWWASSWVWAGRYFEPRVFQAMRMGFNAGGNTTKFHNMGFNCNFSPTGEKDYFGTFRSDFSRFFKSPTDVRFNFWYNSDQRKNYQISMGGYVRAFSKYGMKNFGAWPGISWRLSKKFSTGVSVNPDYQKNDIGYALPEPLAESIGFESVKKDDIIYGRRNVLNLDNTLDLTYTFNTKMNLAFRARHYWSRVDYQEFNLLTIDGELAPTDYAGKSVDGKKLHDLTANFFNIDCIYTWRFAPGSDIIAVWKNAIYTERDDIDWRYFQALADSPTLPQTNTFSLKILYWLDYAAMKKKLAK